MYAAHAKRLLIRTVCEEGRSMNILLVDDQELVLRANKQLVHWKSIGIDRVFTAGNAKDAKRLLLREKIDIMLADIEMPGEDGIALQRWQRDNVPDVTCIFLTSHSDFAYAQEAIHNGVFDYILQPAEITTIEETVGRCVEMRTRRNELLEKSKSYDATAVRSLDWLLSSLFLQKSEFQLMAEWRKETGSAQHDWWYLPCVADLDDKSAEKTFSGVRGTRIRDADFLGPGIAMITGRVGTTCMGIIFLSNNTPPDVNKIRDALETSCAERIWTAGREATVFLGQFSQEDLPDQIQSLMDFREQMVVEKNRIYLVEHHVPSELPAPDGTQWGKWILRNGSRLVENQITNLIRYAKRERYISIRFLQQVIYAFLEALSIACYEQNFLVEDIFTKDYTREMLLHSCTNPDELLRGVSFCLRGYHSLTQRSETQDYSLHERMQEVIRYLEMNMDRMISRKDAAKYVMLNEDYFSRSFKKETGVGYKEFVLIKKMNYAKQLLSETDMPIALIASKVGYDSLTNFSQIFRKYTGNTPTGYRKNYQT